VPKRKNGPGSNIVLLKRSAGNHCKFQNTTSFFHCEMPFTMHYSRRNRIFREGLKRQLKNMARLQESGPFSLKAEPCFHSPCFYNRHYRIFCFLSCSIYLSGNFGGVAGDSAAVVGAAEFHDLVVNDRPADEHLDIKARLFYRLHALLHLIHDGS
jgi:hypothetical protein